MDKFSNVESARNDLLKSKEQLEEEKNISLSFRIKKLTIDGLGNWFQPLSWWPVIHHQWCYSITLDSITLTTLLNLLHKLGITALKAKANELWEAIVLLETEKYDLEERSKRQDYDVSSLFFFGIIISKWNYL